MKKDEKRERMMNRVATQPHSEVQETSTHESGTGKQ